VHKSRVRRRLAMKTAALGVVGAGLLFGAVPAVASLAAPRPVSYTCSPTEAGTGELYNIQIDLVGPAANPTPSQPVQITWRVAQPVTSPSLTAPSPIESGKFVFIDGEIVASGPPLGTVPITLKPTASQPLATPVGDDSPLPTPPAMVATLTPTASGTFSVKAGQFTLRLANSATDTQKTLLYNCVPAQPPNPPTATQLPIAVTVGASQPGTSPSPTVTPTTPKPTTTITQTVTAKPVEEDDGDDEQVTRTPGGGAATGGGGALGPDGRVFVLTGSLLVIAAGVGGLFLRRRGSVRG
jgi:hypothetical protein